MPYTRVRRFCSLTTFWLPLIRTRLEDSSTNAYVAISLKAELSSWSRTMSKQCLPHVAHDVMLEDGRIRASGSPAELKAEGLLSVVMHAAEEPESKGKQVAKDGLMEEEAKDAAVEAKVQSQDDSTDKSDTKTKVAGASGRGKLVTEEGKSTGGVKREVYVMYLSAFGWFSVFLVVLISLSSRAADVFEKYWLSSGETRTRRTVEPVSYQIPAITFYPTYHLLGDSGIGYACVQMSYLVEALWQSTLVQSFSNKCSKGSCGRPHDSLTRRQQVVS